MTDSTSPSSTVVTIRSATPDDVAAVTRIYNDGIEDRVATFETRAREESDVRAWFDAGLPFLVAVDASSEVLGWARVSAYSDRCVYSGVGEHGVYVARAARGRGAGDQRRAELGTALPPTDGRCVHGGPS